MTAPTETLNTTQPPVRAQKGNTVTEVKDSFDGRVTGIVERVNPYARGLVAVVAFHANEKDQYPSRVTVWGDSDTPDVGTRVKVTGRVSWRVEEYNGKHRAQVSINFPTWEVLTPAAPAPILAHDSDDTPF